MRRQFKAWHICAYHMDEIMQGPDFPYENMIYAIRRYEHDMREKYFLIENVLQAANELHNIDIMFLSARKL